MSERKGVCCVCGHRLSDHVDEDVVWRCHALSPLDGYQCECVLRKDRAEDEGISYYNLEKRGLGNEDWTRLKGLLGELK